MYKRKRRIVLKRPLNLVIFTILLLGLFLVKPKLVSLLDKEKPDFSNLESYINTEMSQKKVPGLSMVIFKGQETVYTKAFGVKNSKTGEPVTEDTVFQGASFSKTLTAYAALILVERGQLSLDQPLNRYLKKEYLPNKRRTDQITLRMVLNHTSGLSNDSDGNDRKVYFTPGGLFSYSGAGFRYLQQVIEDVTAMPFAEFMDQTVLKPLGMNSSSFRSKEELLPLMATGHEAGVPFPIVKMEVNAAYSLLTTPTDMAKFNQEICQPKLLKPETITKMLTPSVRWEKDIYWGLGIGVLKSTGENFFWHWGNNYYYCNMMITGIDSKAGVVIMTNGNTGMRLAEHLAIKVINEYFLGPDQGLASQTFDFIT